MTSLCFHSLLQSISLIVHVLLGVGMEMLKLVFQGLYVTFLSSYHSFTSFQDVSYSPQLSL